ncbi:MAG: hypothetical protein Q8Q02_01385 [Nocardioides sp.]|nr:hypothetical protein [Nocardioides sp.]
MVDTRNVKGMLNDVFGVTRAKATARGIKDAVRMYGFDAVEIHAGVATSSPKKSVSDKVTDMLAKNCVYRDRLAADGVKVLEGYLVERDSQVEEKKIDVLLALQVADIVDRMQQGESRARCIVVLSEDMDLMPSYEYAAARDVHVYAAANDTICFRADQEKWLLLHEGAIRVLGEEDDSQGSPTRRYLARLALGTSRSGLPTKWKAVWDQRPGTVTLMNNRGVRGTMYSPEALIHGTSLDLFATEIRFPENGPTFPEVVLSTSAPGPGLMNGVREATVTAWTTPTKVRAKFDDGSQCSVSVSPGSVLQGDQIAVWTTERSTGHAHYYIGPVSALTLPDTWPASTAISTATISGNGDTTFWEAHLEDATAVRVQRTWLTHAGPGDRVAVALAGVHPGTGALHTMPLCCCLPRELQ